MFVGKVIGSLLSGLESYVLLPTEARKLDLKLLKYMRRLELGKACEQGGAHPKAISSADLSRRWRFLPVAGELAARRMKWLQAMVRAPAAAAQVRAAVWGHLPMEESIIDNAGGLRPGANSFAKQF